jgi:predicted SAM-dependent methyltransferase
MKWEEIYKLEVSVGQFVGAKERFVIIDDLKNQILNGRKEPLQILDGGGCPITTALLKEIFQGSTVVSANNEGKPNEVADEQIEVDLGDSAGITNSIKAHFDIIFMGEVFEHIFRPYEGLAALSKKLKPGGHLILTTPNLASIYNRVLLLLGKPLPNYRPIGVTPVEDHVTIVTREQLVNVMQDQLNLKVVAVRGFTYAEKDIVVEAGQYGKSGRRLKGLRHLLNAALPNSFKEGLIYVAQRGYDS